MSITSELVAPGKRLMLFSRQITGTPIDGSYMSEWPVLAHINAISLLDEGTEAVLDILQHSAAATGVLLAVHGFNPEVIDRGRTWPGHGPKGGSGSLGGLFARSAPGVYDGTRLASRPRRAVCIVRCACQD
jgi:hypothetical protein